jgi:hypothetical protein
MKQNSRQLTRAVTSALGLLAIAGVGMPSRAAANEVLDWNVIGLEASATGGQNAAVVSRSMAMMQLAVHDALNAIDRRYQPYLYLGKAEPPADPGAAVAAAARHVLVEVIPSWGRPEQRAKALNLVEGAYKTALAKLANGPAKDKGLAVGSSAAAAILMARKDDGSSAPSRYKPANAPGRWRPHPNPVPPAPPIPDPAFAVGNWPPILPQWGSQESFTMATPWQFRLPGPPALVSMQYAWDYEEVKRLGSKTSTARTAEQSEIARYWYEGSPDSWSRIARVVAAQRGLDRWDSARLLALVNVAIADGFIAGYDTRYHYDLWRPITAIRAADTDGNDATTADPTWESFLNTPAIPEYPSTHSIAGGASSAVLARFFGKDEFEFRMTSGAPFAGITRSFKSFSQASQENAESRIYAGVHFRSACRDGIKLGEQIGRRVTTLFLQPVSPMGPKG